MSTPAHTVCTTPSIEAIKVSLCTLACVYNYTCTCMYMYVYVHVHVCKSVSISLC